MKFNNVMPKMKVDPETYVSHLFFWVSNAERRANVKPCHRSSRRMEWSVKLSLPQSCHWHRDTMSINATMNDVHDEGLIRSMTIKEPLKMEICNETLRSLFLSVALQDYVRLYMQAHDS